MSPGNRCYARFTAGGRRVTISDHGFRVDILDTMFFSPLEYNSGTTQVWRGDPLTAAAGELPTDVNSVQWLRKRTVVAEPRELNKAQMGWDDLIPPPEPNHLRAPPSRVKRGMAHHGEAFPASRPQPGTPIQTDVDTSQELVSAHDPVQTFEKSRNSSMSLNIRQLDFKEYCDAGEALELVNDMDALYGYCDCIGWDGK
jgi:hypothetical protein